MLTEFDIEMYLFVSSLLLILLIDFTMSSNLVQAIVCLIFSYLIVATHFRILNATYLAIVLILVYVGAISVLFLWLLMTIEEVDEPELLLADKVVVKQPEEVKKPEKTYDNYYRFFVVRRILHNIEMFFKPLVDFLKEVYEFIVTVIKVLLVTFTAIRLIWIYYVYVWPTSLLNLNPFFREPHYIWSKQEFDMNDMFF